MPVLPVCESNQFLKMKNEKWKIQITGVLRSAYFRIRGQVE